MAEANSDSVYDFDWRDYIIGIGFILFFLLDVGTDLRLAAEYFMEEQWLSGSITTAPIVLAYLVVCFFALANYHIIRVDLSDDFVYISRYEEAVPAWVWVVRFLLLVLGLSPVIRTLEFLYCGYKSSCRNCLQEARQEYREHTLDIALSLSFIRIIESYMEAAPQLCLQLYIIFKIIPDNPVAGASLHGVVVVTSWLSLALSAVTLYKTKRYYTTGNMNVCSQLVRFLWRAFETGGRVLCLTLFASRFETWVFVVLGVQLALVALWDICVNARRNRQGNSRVGWKTVVSAVLLGYVSLFYFPFSFAPPRTTQSQVSPPSRFVYLLFYVIFYIENFVMLTLWALVTSDHDEWFVRAGIFTVIVFFFLHILTQLVYYKFSHPNSDDIKICLPWGIACKSCDRSTDPVCETDNDGDIFRNASTVELKLYFERSINE